MQEVAQAFPAEGRSVAAARRFASESAERWELGELCWPLVQIVSELASNAVIHAGTEFTVRLTLESGLPRVEVWDGSARRAQPRDYGLDATTGRGLRLVEMLSRDWGVSARKGGKAVWAIVDGAESDDDAEAVLELFLGADQDEDRGERRGRSARAPRAKTTRDVVRDAA
ncbi:MAG TPA: ATP-binding protein [Mycobacteriales bacterium]|nr:ATP-binding protein [Mycobacteriales bacterium]